MSKCLAASLLLLWSLVAVMMTELSAGKFYGLCYTPYRVYGVCPTDEEVESDVQILLRHTTRVRTYSTECRNVNRILLKHSSEGRLSILFGVYVDNRPTDQQEVDYLIEALKEFPNGRIEGVVVGNEVMYRNSLPKSFLLGRISEVRNKVRGLAYHNGNESYRKAPIYAVEIFPDNEIAGASDANGLNIHPFYRPDLQDVSDPDVMADKILVAAQQQIDMYRNMMPSKPIVVTEIGWPTYSDPSEMHRGNPIIALKFMYKFTDYAAKSGIQVYWFECFDSPWKKPMFPTNQNTMSEFNFGLYKADRKTMKQLPGGCSDCGKPKEHYPAPQTHYPAPHEAPSGHGYPKDPPAQAFTGGKAVTSGPAANAVAEAHAKFHPPGHGKGHSAPGHGKHHAPPGHGKHHAPPGHHGYYPAPDHGGRYPPPPGHGAGRHFGKGGSHSYRRRLL